MINAVIDTNVLVSGLITSHGYPARIINAFKEKQFNLLYCSEILIEYRDVLYRGRFGLKSNDVDDLLDVISLNGIPVTTDASNITLTDEDDRCFFDVAKNTGAYLVTGNLKHYPNDSTIITPADFVKLLDA